MQAILEHYSTIWQQNAIPPLRSPLFTFSHGAVHDVYSEICIKAFSKDKVRS